MKNLFIYIPTYNRPEAIRTQLCALAPQVAKNQSRVRVLVNDNASSNYSFDEVINDFSIYKNIKFQKNGGNIGGNANISLGFVFSQPDEFLWILSDNDIVTESALDYLLPLLEDKVDFFCFLDSDQEPVEIDYSWSNGWQTPMDWRMGLISDALYNTNTVKNSIDQAFYFHNSSFPHLAVGCAAAKKQGIVRFKLLPRSKINSELYRSDESPTDYSLAHVGMPLLAALFPPAEAKSFSINWLRSGWMDMYGNRKRHYHLYLQTRATLGYHGGWVAKSMMLWMGPGYFILNPICIFKQKCIEIFKKRLSPQMLEKLKKLRRKFG
jgi:hypothetical protein